MSSGRGDSSAVRTGTVGNCIFSCKSVPASEVSGDFPHCWETADNKVLFSFFDVSGHGISSAVIGNFLNSLIEHYIEQHSRVVVTELLAHLNERILVLKIDFYATVVVGLIDTERRRLRYSVAGHWPLPMLKTDGRVCRLRGEGTQPVGLMPGFEALEYSRSLPDDFRLLICSDGVQQHLGVDSLADGAKLLEDVLRCSDSAEDIYRRLGIDSVQQTRDDVTALVIERALY